MPTAIIGASIGSIGTALAQQPLRNVMAFCNARQMTAPEAYIHLRDGAIDEDGNILDEGLQKVLEAFMTEFKEHVRRVLTVLPRD